MASNDRILLENVLRERRASIAPDMAPDDYFELFLAEQILWDFDLSYSELQSGLVGGTEDGGIDGAFVFCNGSQLFPGDSVRNVRGSVEFELFIMQAKLTEGFSETAVDKLRITLMALLNLGKDLEESRSLYNDDLLAVFQLFRSAYVDNSSKFPSVRISIGYGSLGNDINLKVELKAKALERDLASLFSESVCNFQFCTPSYLVTLARRLRPATLGLALSDTIATSSGDGFVGLVRIGEYYRFISTSDRSLQTSIFDSNVRDYEGTSGVNSAIRGTLIGSWDEEFWWLNNGVTIVAERAAQQGKTVRLEYPQIVNGLQTSREIFDYVSAKPDAETDDPRSVLVRIVVPPNDAIRDGIIRATNSQTPIPSVALRATDRIQRDIEDYFLQQGYFYERRKNKYQNDGRPLERIVTIPYLAEAVLAAVRYQPHLGGPRMGGRFLRDDNIYKEIFDDRISLESFFNAMIVARIVEARFRERRGSRARDLVATASSKTRLRYLYPVITALTIQKSFGTSINDVAMASISATDIDYWIEVIRDLDPAGVRKVRPDSAERIVTEGVIRAARSMKPVGHNWREDPIGLVAWAEKIARRKLETSENARWIHTQGVVLRAQTVLPLVGNDAELLLAAAFLHDIGYALNIRKTGNVGVDGARYLRSVNAPDRLVGLIADHWRNSCLQVVDGSDSLSSEFETEGETVLRDALWWSDLTTNAAGQITSIGERLEELAGKTGNASDLDAAYDVGPMRIAVSHVEARLRGDAANAADK
jgi:hypothetical protein